jgi:hypothetical protein
MREAFTFVVPLLLRRPLIDSNFKVSQHKVSNF